MSNPNDAIVAVVRAAQDVEPRDDVIDVCVVCGEDILTQVWKGTGVCGERDRKIRDKVENEERALAP